MIDKYQHFEQELTALINRLSIDSDAHLPDFIIAGYLIGCLEVLKDITAKADQWSTKDENKKD